MVVNRQHATSVTVHTSLCHEYAEKLKTAGKLGDGDAMRGVGIWKSTFNWNWNKREMKKTEAVIMTTKSIKTRTRFEVSSALV